MSCQTSSGYSSAAPKFNWSNVLAEYKKGSDSQSKLNFFKEIRIDFNYNYKLYGPFNADTSVLKERIVMNDGKPEFEDGEPVVNVDEVPPDGSTDLRTSTNYSYDDWDDKTEKFNESANKLTHYVINPNVKKFFVTLQVNQLSDQLEKSTGRYPNYTMEAGAQMPAIFRFKISWGKESENGSITTTGIANYKMIALVASQCLIDIGNPDDAGGLFKTVMFEGPDPYTIFNLPSASGSGNELDVTYDERNTDRRWVSIEKVTAETNSSLVVCNASLAKITEVQEADFSYPYSTIVGTKIDSRVFNSVPKRTFDCRLKKIKIPTNYYPLNGNGVDKRYIKVWNGIPCTSVYQGNWGGGFKIGWTDNPAWILYDMITNPRYGLGNYIKEEDVNKWDLYKIARWCDGVDENGDYVGVCDYKTGREPRFAANIMFSAETAIFDAINAIISIFRGAIYYQNNKVEFTDDRPRPAIAVFNNHNVKDGLFSYSNYKKDEQYNSVEVIYIDKDDDYRTKAEYVQNNGDIGKRGPVTKTINAIGCTSAGQARRTGLSIIYQTTVENQSVTFDCGYEAMLCKPGDYIEIEDELKTHNTNYGRIIEANWTEGWIRLNNDYDPDAYSSKITVYYANETTYEGQNQLNYELGSLDQTIELQVQSYTKNDDFGCYVWIEPTDDQFEALKQLQVGSAYRFRMRERDPELYRVIVIKENDKSSFSVVAQKYNPERFDYIECDPIGDPPPPEPPKPYLYVNPPPPEPPPEPEPEPECPPSGTNFGQNQNINPCSMIDQDLFASVELMEQPIQSMALPAQIEESPLITQEEPTQTPRTMEATSGEAVFEMNKLNSTTHREDEDIYRAFLDPFSYSIDKKHSD